MREDELQHIAICPGNFDPITEGHLDVIGRASQMFGKIWVGVAEDSGKTSMFTVAERVEMARSACADLSNVEVDSFTGLVVEYAKQQGAVTLVRGLRAVSDFEREMQMACMNRRLAPEIYTVFLVPHPDYAFLSSSIVKEVASMGGDVSKFVPAVVLSRLREKIARRSG